MSYSNKWTQEIKQTLSQVLSESKRPTKEDENILKRTQEKEEAEKRKWKETIKGSGPKKYTSKYDEKAMDYALGVHGNHTYDHVEHEGNSLQEEMALNEDLLMLIDVLCEELGIDIDDLLNLDEGSRGSKRLLRKAGGIAKRLERVSKLPSTDFGKFDATRELADRALTTQKQIDDKLKTSTKRASRRAVASAIGDKSARQADAQMKAKTGETTGEHATRNVAALRQASRRLGDMNVNAVGRRTED